MKPGMGRPLMECTTPLHALDGSARKTRMANVVPTSAARHLSAMDTKFLACIRPPPRIDGAVRGKGSGITHLSR